MQTAQGGGETIEYTPIEVARSQVLTPSLNIFLGSTPSIAALEMMRQMLDLPAYDRDRVALLFIDIDSPPPAVAAFMQSHIGELKTFVLRISVTQNVLYADQLANDIATHTYIPNKIPESFDSGAGGIRNNGHVAACSYHDQIIGLLDKALAQVTAIPSYANPSVANGVLINIITFLGGGTGSGIIGDLTVMARNQVLRQGLDHRMNLFCLLPESVSDVQDNDIRRRRANATATLLELIALTLARSDSAKLPGGAPAGAWGPPTERSSAIPGAPKPMAGDRSYYAGPARYVKYMGPNKYVVRGTTIANEVYLFGRSGTNSITDSARILGMDLSSRVTNASGVGFLEISKCVDRTSLASREAASGLPTMFGTTCPLEVVFPALETAQAFAERRAADVLPLLAPDAAPGGAAPDPAEIRDATVLREGLQPQLPPDFDGRSFIGAGWNRLNNLAIRLNTQVDQALQDFRDGVDQVRKRERQAILDTSQQSPSQQIAELRRRERVYSQALSQEQDIRVPPRRQLNKELQNRMMRAPDFAGMRDRATDAVMADYNLTQRHTIAAAAHTMRMKLFEELRGFARAQLDTLKSFVANVNMKQAADELRRRATGSAAWRGQLEEGLLHRRHLFDLPGMPGMNEENSSESVSPPVSRLYALLSRGSTPESLATRFQQWVQETYGEDAGLTILAPAQLPGRVVRFLREGYLRRLRQRNLIEIIEACCVLPNEDPRAKARKVLLAHLQHIASLARGLIAFEEQLALDGAEKLTKTLFLGINWSDASQETLISEILGQLGTIGRAGATPYPQLAKDPHRLQVVYGQHGISLSTVPEFSLDDNTSMSDLLARQAAWQGQTLAEYGQNQEPVFSSGEMERLAMDPSALGDVQSPPRDLPRRVIRSPQRGAGGAPGWLAQRSAQGWPSQGDGQSPQSGGYPGSGLPPQAPPGRPGGALPPNLPF